jgi:hypothetical protein
MAELSLVSQPHSSRQLRRWFWILLLLNLVFIIGSKFYLRPFNSNEIIRFEIAKDVDVAGKIVQQWNSSGADNIDKAIQSIYLDYLFIFLYVSVLSIACIYFSKLTRHDILKKAGRFFGFLIIAAGFCDVLENIAMWYSLNGYLNQWNVSVAYDMAVTKFSIIIVSLLFLINCLIFYLLEKLSPKKT